MNNEYSFMFLFVDDVDFGSSLGLLDVMRIALRALAACAAFAAVDLHVEAAYFHVKEGEEKCFLETVPNHQVLTAITKSCRFSSTSS